jgi:hypothetical protein
LQEISDCNINFFMNKNYITTSFLCFLIICIQSCGYRLTEEDKYPDMPIYPHISNSDYSIDSIMKIENSSVKYTDQFLYTISFTKSNKDVESAHLSILNKNMDIVKEIQWNPLFSKRFIYNVDENNNIYIVSENQSLYKYAYPWERMEEVPKILDVTKRDSLEVVYLKTIQKRQKVDSLFYIGAFIDSIFNSKVKKLYDMNDCVLPIDGYNTNYYVVLNDSNGRQSYAIITDYSELWQTSYQNRKLNCDSLVHQYTYSNKTAAPNLILEQAALGNRSSGNHFVFGFTPYGYDYYKITVDKDTICFKIENNNLTYPLFRQFGGLFTDKIILYKNDVLYTVKKKNE